MTVRAVVCHACAVLATSAGWASPSAEDGEHDVSDERAGERERARPDDAARHVDRRRGRPRDLLRCEPAIAFPPGLAKK